MDNQELHTTSKIYKEIKFNQILKRNIELIMKKCLQKKYLKEETYLKVKLQTNPFLVQGIINLI